MTLVYSENSSEVISAPAATVRSLTAESTVTPNSDNSNVLASYTTSQSGHGEGPGNILIPLVCVAIYVIVMVVLGVSYSLDKRRKHVETANFDFHHWRIGFRLRTKWTERQERVERFVKDILSFRKKEEPVILPLQNVEKRQNYGSRGYNARWQGMV